MKIFSVAIDGPGGAGKSTIARAVSAELGISYVDTGALYRTVGLYVFRRGVEAGDAEKIIPMLSEIKIDISFENGVQTMRLNGEDVTREIRRHEISHYASAVSAIPEVRDFLLSLQRELAARQSVVMDGRDIGTVVLPRANVKIFLTARPEVRAKRRYKELLEKGAGIDYDTVLKDMRERDYRDSHRAVAPLKPSEDGVTLDTSEMTLERAIEEVKNIIKKRVC